MQRRKIAFTICLDRSPAGFERSQAQYQLTNLDSNQAKTAKLWTRCK